MMHRIFVIASILFASIFKVSAADTYVKQEMRSGWLATVWGLDWPSKTGTSSTVIAQQKAELTDLLDKLKAAGLNAVSFQVRSYADAMYKSSYEPWSRFLTGTRGTAPSDASWDPLAFCVEECHKRGLECHAWVNPFRFATSSTLPSTSYDMTARNNGWIITYAGTNATTSILDPGNAGARAHIVKVCKEIVTNYDIDGLMFDDYFYPEGLPLGSGYDYSEWKASGTSMTQANWRRNNVRTAVKEVYNMIQSVKPYVKFGVSPAGVGGGPNGEAAAVYGLPKSYGGYDWIYNGIYCDPLPWLADKTVDYVSPQIYWTRASTSNPYEPIAKWWSEVADHFGRHFYSSHSLENFASTNTSSAWSERGAQIDINRKYTLNDAPGSIFYSVKYISGPGATGFGDYLVQNNFKEKALTPALPWKNATNPGTIRNFARTGDKLTWTAISGIRYVTYAVPMSVYPYEAASSTGAGLKSEYIIDVCYSNSCDIPSNRRSGYWYAVTPYDRHSNEWAATTLNAPTETYERVVDSTSDTTISGADGSSIKLKNIWIRSDVHGNSLRLLSDNNYNRDFVVRPADAKQSTDMIYVTDVTSVSLPSDCALQRYDAATGERLDDLQLKFDEDYASVGYTNLNGVMLDDESTLVVHNLKIGDNPLFIGKVNPSTGVVTCIAELSTGNDDRIDHIDVCGSVSGNYTVFGASYTSNTIYRWLMKRGHVDEMQSVKASQTMGVSPRLIAIDENYVMANGSQSHLLVYRFPSATASSIHVPASGQAATRANGGDFFIHDKTRFMVAPEQSYDLGFKFRLFHGDVLPYIAVSGSDAIFPSASAGLGMTMPPSGDFGALATHYSFVDGDNLVTRFYVFANNNGMAGYELTSKYSGVDAVEADYDSIPSVEGFDVKLGCKAQSARLFDTKGSLVSSGRDVETIVAPCVGIYILRMVDADGKMSTRKIVIE